MSKTIICGSDLHDRFLLIKDAMDLEPPMMNRLANAEGRQKTVDKDLMLSKLTILVLSDTDREKYPSGDKSPHSKIMKCCDLSQHSHFPPDYLVAITPNRSVPSVCHGSPPPFRPWRTC
jgi:hypothetical protein